MILVDTSVWIEHFRNADPQLADLLDGGLVLMHPFVVGEIACGNLANRTSVLDLLQQLPMAVEAQTGEVLRFVESNALYGRGIGYVDVHLLAATMLTPETTLWTRDKRLHEAAETLGCAYLDVVKH